MNRKARNIRVLDKLELCAMTKSDLVAELFKLPTKPLSASIYVAGMPGAVASKENEGMANLYNRATISTIDGMPFVKIAKSKGINCERCSGPDIMGMVFKESIKQNKTHYFYGGDNDTVLGMLRENLERDYNGIKIVGMYSPPFRELTEEEDKKLCDDINGLKPDFVWVGIGAPKQEVWIMNHCSKINDCVMLGVGAAFNYIAGTVDKAPKWVENMCLEWLYRLFKEPKRMWRRSIIGGCKMLYYIIHGWIRGEKIIQVKQ